MSMEPAGEPLTEMWPSTISRSSTAASSAWAAILSAFSRTLRAVIATALPLITAVREANVPTAYLKRRVSPVVTVILSNGTPSSSATIWASIVWWPWPCEVSPVETTTLPSVSTRMWPPS